MTEYSQGVCQDGAAILRDGKMMTIEEILGALWQRDQAEIQLRAIQEDLAECGEVSAWNASALDSLLAELSAHNGGEG